MEICHVASGSPQKQGTSGSKSLSDREMGWMRALMGAEKRRSEHGGGWEGGGTKGGVRVGGGGRGGGEVICEREIANLSLAPWDSLPRLFPDCNNERDSH